jgi:ABC-2 family transporter protein
MPQARINDRGYRRYEGERRSGGRWWVVARQLMWSMRRQRAVIALAILTAFPTVIAGVWLYFVRSDAQKFVYNLYLFTFFPALIMALRAGGGAVADDARAGGFQFYFARPITHGQYLAGKLLGVGLLVALVSALPGVLLALLNFTLAATAASLLVVAKAALLGLLAAAAFSCVTVALSSLIRRRGLVQAAMGGVIFLPWVLGASFRDFTRTPWPALGSIAIHLGAVGQWLMERPNEIGDRAMPPWIALAMLALFCAASVWVALRQLRRAEVVAG